MQCRNCGTEIADKAIVCYRCGHATTDPVRKPVPLKRRRRPVFSMLAAMILAALAIALAYGSPAAADPEQWQTLAAVLGGAAAVVLILGLLRWRR